MTRQFCGRSVRNLYLRQSYKLNIIAIENGGKTTTEIDPDYVLREGDILVVIGKENRISEFGRRHLLGRLFAEESRAKYVEARYPGKLSAAHRAPYPVLSLGRAVSPLSGRAPLRRYAFIFSPYR